MNIQQFSVSRINAARSNVYDVRASLDTITDFAGDLFVVVFSMDCRESFEEAIRLREAILETKVSATQSATKSRRAHYSLKVPMVIVGNKCDKDVKYVFFPFSTLASLSSNNLSPVASNYFTDKFPALVTERLRWRRPSNIA